MITIVQQSTITIKLAAKTPYLIPPEEVALPSSSYASETKAIIVSPKTIRVYEGLQMKVYYHGIRAAKSAFFTETWMLIMGLTTTDTTIKGFLIAAEPSSPRFHIGFP
jgi:hypothetical protein